MAEQTRIRWAESTWNPITGCTKISPGCDHCLTPETPVLMADMTWRKIGDVAVGDQLVAFDEMPTHRAGQRSLRSWQPATVLAKWDREEEAIELTFADGRTIVASDEHRFLMHCSPWWRTAFDIAQELWSGHRGRRPKIMSPGIGWTASMNGVYLDGYVAGAFGGDGTVRLAGSGHNDTPQSYARVAVLATDRPILDRIALWFDAAGFDTPEIQPFDHGSDGAPMLKIETRRRKVLESLQASFIETDDPNWYAGFLAGFLDTDGSYSGKNLRWNQVKDNGLLDLTLRALKRLGYTGAPERYGKVAGVRLATNTLDEKVRFLSAIQPALVRKCADFYDRQFPGTHVEVVSARRVGRVPLVDITTSTQTFIANGLATHNCYAEALTTRFGPSSSAFPVGFTPTFKPKKLDEPSRILRKLGRVRIFCNSLSDPFHEDFDDAVRDAMFDVVLTVPQHDYLMLTKRPQAMARYFLGDDGYLARRGLDRLPPHFWLGTSIENDRYTFRARHLTSIPAHVHFLSCEPLLGPLPSLDLTDIEWVIVGGESGNGTNDYRKMDPDWARDLRDRCRAAEIAFYYKQDSAHRTELRIRLDGELIEEYPLQHPADRHALGAEPVVGRWTGRNRSVGTPVHVGRGEQQERLL